MVQTLTKAQYDEAINRANPQQKVKLQNAFNTGGIKITQDATQAYQGGNIGAGIPKSVDNSVKHTTNMGNLNNVKPTQPTNVQPQQETTVKSQTPTQTSQITQNKPVEAPKTTPIVQKEKQKQPVSSFFGYSTTPEEREQRNATLASGILEANKQFDRNYLAGVIKSYAPNVTEADIQNTISDIENKYNTLKVAKQQAINNNNKLTKWATMTVDQLAKSNLSTDDLNLLKTNNPDKFNELNTYNQNQNKLSLLNDKTTVEEVKPTESGLTTATIDLNKIHNELYNTDDMKKASSEMNNKAKTVKDLQNSMKNILDNTRKRYEGTGATESYIRAKAQKELEAVQQQYDTAVSEYELAKDNYTTLKSNADESYKTQVEQYNINRQATQDKIDNFKLQYGIYKDQQALEAAKKEREDKWNTLFAQQDFAREQAQTAFEQKYGNIDSKDPNIQKLAVDNAVSDIMEQYKGWTFSRSKQQMVDDVLKSVKQGKTLGQALGDNITGQLQKNPNFNKWLQSNSTPKTDYVEVTGSDGNTYMVNKNDPTKMVQIGGLSPATTDGYSLLNAPDGAKGGQCGSYVNKILGTNFGNSFESKLSKVNTDTPTVGSAVVMTSAKYPQYGHVAVVTNVYDDGSFDIKESNWGGDEKVHSRNIKSDDKTVKGFYNPNTTGKSSEEVIKKTIKGTPATKQDIENQLLQTGLGGTEGERQTLINNLYKQGISVEELKSKYITRSQQKIRDDITTNMDKVQTDYVKTSNKLNGIINLLDNPNVGGGTVAMALKSFTASIDNTAAMQGEVNYTVSAGKSLMDQLATKVEGYASGKVPADVLQKIKETVYDFNNGLTEATKDYYVGKNNIIKKQFGDYQLDELSGYTPKMIQRYPDGTQIEYDGKGNYTYKGTDGQWSDWTPEGQPVGIKTNYSKLGNTTEEILNNTKKSLSQPTKQSELINKLKTLIK